MRKIFLQQVLSVLFLAAIADSLNAQVHLNQNFNGGSIPAGWTVSDGGAGECRWNIKPSSALLPMLGTNFLYVDSDSAGPGTIADETITSPVISYGPATQVKLSMKYYFRDLTGDSDTGSVEVFNGSTWVQVLVLTQTTGTPASPVSAEINLSSYLNPNLRIRFRYVGDYAYYWAIDDVKIFTPSANNLGTARFLNASATCGIALPFTPQIRIYNAGSQAQSNFQVGYKIGNQPAVSQTFTGSIAAGDSASFTFSSPFSTSQTGNIPAKAWTALSADGDLTNDTASASLFIAQATFSQVGFDGFDGSNISQVFPGWQEFSGLNPQPGFSAWGVSTAAQTTGLGSQTARINLYTTGKREWIVSPAFVPAPATALRFKVAVTNWNSPDADQMGSDDSLIVKVTTNCGQTWQSLVWYTAADNLANELNEKTLSLAAFAGQNIRIAFYGSEGSTDDPNDYDVHIDDIALGVVSANDLQLAAVLLPVGNCGVPASFPVRLRLVNNGSVAQNQAPLSYRLGSQTVVSQTFPVSLPAGADTILEFSTPITLSAGGNYSLSAWVALPSDGNSQNDSLLNRPFFRPEPSLALQNFANYNGDNLSSGWQEFNGPAASLFPGSSWVSSSFEQQTGLGSMGARVNLFSNFRQEWIVSPAMIPSANSTALRFKLAATGLGTMAASSMGSDDSLIVRVTTNCGQTWQNLAWFTAADGLSNSYTEKTVSLAAFANQTIRIAFFATDGDVDDAEDYNLHIDDIQTGILSGNDLQLAGILLPGGNCGVPASFPVRVRLVNSGAISQSSAPFSYQVAGQAVVSQTFSISLPAGADTILEFNTPVSVTAGGNYSISAWVSLPVDSNSQNDSVIGRPFYRPTGSFPNQTFTGYNGNNLSDGWQEFNGAGPNLLTGSAWASGNTVQIAGFGTETARVNLYSSSKKEWLMSPAILMNSGKALRFKLAVTDWTTMDPAEMGSDDSLVIKVTTNCGQTWQNIRSFTTADNLSNQLTEFNLSLSPFIGQSIRIAFFATEGSTDDLNDYDLHLDDVQLINLNPTDVGLSSLIVPSAECGLPSIFPVKVRLANFGTQPQSGIALAYSVNGGAAVTASYSGTLAAGEVVIYEFSQPADISQPGSYVIKAWTSLSGDQDSENDTLSSAPLSPTPPELPSVDFSGFDGSNLSTLFPGWMEKSGDSPSGTTSFWNTATASQAASLGSSTARVGLLNNSRREWIISPGFRPAPQSELRFSLALTAINFATAATMGNDDSLKVLISTDCGLSWNVLEAYTAQSGLTNSLVPKTIDLSSYAGQSCQIAFKATSGLVSNSQTTDLHLDNIQTGPLTSVSKYRINEDIIRVIPNPVNNGLMEIKFLEQNSDVRFFSAAGAEVFPVRESGKPGYFNVGKLPTGLYFVKSGNAACKFIIP